jgi:hypothetical protein
MIWSKAFSPKADRQSECCQDGGITSGGRRLGNYRGTESMVDISRGAAHHLKAWAEEVNGLVLHASTVMSAI